MNCCIFIGRLTSTPELKTTQSGKSVTDFSIAVSRKAIGSEQADFIRCTAWDKVAEVITKYKRQGDMISVTGRLTTETYKDKNGNDRSKTYVLVNQVEFIGNAPARDPDNGQIPDAETDDFPF